MTWLQRLVRKGIALPLNVSPDLAGGDAIGNEVYYDNPADQAQGFARVAASQAQPSMVNVTDEIPSPDGPTAYATDSGPGPQPTTSVLSDTLPEPSASTELPATINMPRFLRPTTDQVSDDSIMSPRLTKLGKLMTLIKVATQGASAGHAASERALIESGGRRSGGFGLGFEAGMEQPLVEQNLRNRVEAGSLENEQRRTSLALMPLQVAVRQRQLANMDAETQARLAHAAYRNSARGQKDQLTLQQLHAQAVEKAIGEHRDPNADPDVQAYADAIQAIQRPSAQHADSPFLEWRNQNPDAPIEQWFDMQHRSEARYRKPDQNEASPTQFADIEKRKNDRYTKLHAFQWNSETGDFEDSQGRTMSPDDYASREQEIEDGYRAEIRAAGGHPAPFSYAQQRGTGQGKQLDEQTAKSILAEAGGNKEKARNIARQRGFKF